MRKLKASITDAQPTVRKFLRQTLERHFDLFELLGEAEDERGLAGLLAQAHDLAVVDPILKNEGCLLGALAMLEAAPQAPILVLTVLNEPKLHCLFRFFGAAEVCIKGTDTQELFSAIERTIAQKGSPHRHDPQLLSIAKLALNTESETQIAQQLKLPLEQVLESLKLLRKACDLPAGFAIHELYW